MLSLLAASDFNPVSEFTDFINHPYVDLPLGLDINKGVVYLWLSAATAILVPLLIIRQGSESGKQVWNGTLTSGDAQRFDARHGLWVYIGSPENVGMKLNGRSVLVGGAKPRSLIVTSGDIVPAGPGT
jgi:hypothetical protein